MWTDIVPCKLPKPHHTNGRPFDRYVRFSVHQANIDDGSSEKSDLEPGDLLSRSLDFTSRPPRLRSFDPTFFSFLAVLFLSEKHQKFSKGVGKKRRK
ncbi:hypothetical protein AVEN_193994-1 [Araneus ventricosus]|uniref:Uncharacterized protein n=1 Tax=Araneus ventricosus TaxID=182803 RepID=A0A4Y2NI88_ARAVE|nr:hypothetical protein AVEN_193994-1 [Araneus ventricosus]